MDLSELKAKIEQDQEEVEDLDLDDIDYEEEFAEALSLLSSAYDLIDDLTDPKIRRLISKKNHGRLVEAGAELADFLMQHQGEDS